LYPAGKFAAMVFPVRSNAIAQPSIQAMGIAELACVLSSAVEAVESDAQSVTKLLLQLCSLLESPEAATELDEILLDLHVTLMNAAELSPAAEAAVRQLLAFAAAQCTAREVFTLCMATLAQELRQAACAWLPAVPPAC
jgi:hypothetical protein